MTREYLLLVLTVVSIFFLGNNSQAQSKSEIQILPVYNPSAVLIKVNAQDKCLTHQGFISSEDKTVQVRAFAQKDYNGQELFIPTVKVDLVRKGLLIDKSSFDGLADLSWLIKQAKQGDHFVFIIDELLIKSSESTYHTFTKKRIRFHYQYLENGDFAYNETK